MEEEGKEGTEGSSSPAKAEGKAEQEEDKEGKEGEEAAASTSAAGDKSEEKKEKDTDMMKQNEVCPFVTSGSE